MSKKSENLSDLSKKDRNRGGFRGGGGGAAPGARAPKIGKNMIFFGVKS